MIWAVPTPADGASYWSEATLPPWSCAICCACLVAFESASTSSTRRPSSASKRWSWPGAGAIVDPVAASFAAGATGAAERSTGGVAASDGAVAAEKVCSSAAEPADVARLPSRESPITPAATSATTTVAGTASTSRRQPQVNRIRSRKGSRAGSWAALSARTRSRSGDGASGFVARISCSSVSDMDAHLLLELLQGSRQPGRDRGGADPEHARRVLVVQFQQDAQRDHLALGGAELAQRRLELG